jgi:hypothetical protein
MGRAGEMYAEKQQGLSAKSRKTLVVCEWKITPRG